MTDEPAGGIPDPIDTAAFDWATHQWYRVLGYYFAVATSDASLAHYVETVLGDFTTVFDPAESHSPPTPGVPVRYELVDPDTAGDSRFHLTYNGVTLASSIRPSDVFDQFFWHVNAESARRTGEFVLIHSGAVATSDGAGVLIPGTSGAGKSTLVSGLLHAGFGYYSDEAAAIDPIGRLLHGYPKAITLKDRTVFDTYPDLPSAQTNPDYVGSRWYIVPSQVRPDIVGSPTTVGYVVVSRFQPGSATKVSNISKAEAAMVLGRNVINIVRYKRRVLPLLGDLVRDAVCFSLVSGDLKEAVAAVAEATSA